MTTAVSGSWTLVIIFCCLLAASEAFVLPAPGGGLVSSSSPHNNVAADAHAVSSLSHAPNAMAGLAALRTPRQQPQQQQNRLRIQQFPSPLTRRGRPLGSNGSNGEEGKKFGPGSWESSNGSKNGAVAEAEREGGGAGGVSDNRTTRSKLKAELLRKVATLNRGFVAQEADRVDVEEIVEMLELENPNPTPCDGFVSKTSPIAGRWQLLYTTSLDVLSLQVNPAVTIGQIFQNVEEDGRAIQNIIELQPPFAAVANRILGSSLATLTVKLESEPVSNTRIDLKFTRTEIKANSVFGRELDLPTLGVDIPSGDKLQKILAKGKNRVQNAKRKAQEVARKVKNKQNDSNNDSSKGTNSDGDSSQDTNDEGVVDADLSDSNGDASTDETDTSAEPTSKSTVLKPYFETTYVDDELRVGRTGSGDLFVSARL